MSLLLGSSAISKDLQCAVRQNHRNKALLNLDSQLNCVKNNGLPENRYTMFFFPTTLEYLPGTREQKKISQQPVICIGTYSNGCGDFNYYY
jgi:hypothetical protein